MTTAANPNTVEAVAGELRVGLHDIGPRDTLSEEDTKESLIRPVLEKLGYPRGYRTSETSSQRNRPDVLCYLDPANTNPRHAAIIIEAKEYGADFDKRRAGQARQETPDRQIQRYLKGHSASGPNTIGVLTDGIRWRIYHRAGTAANPDARFVAEYNFNTIANPEQSELPGPATDDAAAKLACFVNLLSWESLTFGVNRRLLPPPPPRVCRVTRTGCSPPCRKTVSRRKF